MAILKLNRDNERREIDFELKYLMSLTTKQRFELMFRKTKEMLSFDKKQNANRKTTQVIKRKSR
jgi:hypothetical protein